MATTRWLIASQRTWCRGCGWTIQVGDSFWTREQDGRTITQRCINCAPEPSPLDLMDEREGTDT
jgi:hypothetical protein